MPTEYSPPRGKGLRQRLPEEVRTELLMLLEDLNAVGIVHGDIKFNNILSRASESWLSSEVCPRHKQVHSWRLVDFDRSFKITQPMTFVTSSDLARPDTMMNTAIRLIGKE
ncbi:hypothetical protein GGU10DRAFT_350619 [Lentinula aff. detonsa]|uniref:Protein kinase domain-containing protein n=1 Tax=Lentinula aff. detonsa TaxID=2804958 RepID=A0AA38NK76_9AGAR|nr:hypothetical protein GGU10DRAFT_350619 [Lentinula aff. detonsa]